MVVSVWYILIGGILVSGGATEPDNRRAGVSHVTITVSNLTASTHFYTKILGGMLAEDLSSPEPTASREYIQMFSGEYTSERDDCRNGGDVDSATNCQKLSEDWEVSWSVVIFDNMMVQLVQYNSLTAASEESTVNGTKSEPTPMMPDMMGNKLAFWIKDSVNLSEYANFLENESRKQGFPQVKFMRPLLLSSTASLREANEGVRELRDDRLKGLSIGYAKGPDGESLKFIQLIGSSREEFGKHYCRGRVVSAGLLDTYLVDKCGEYKTGKGSQHYGVNHISISTMDINRTLAFLVDELGGYYIEDIQPSHLQSPALEKLLMSRLKAPSVDMMYKTKREISGDSNRFVRELSAAAETEDNSDTLPEPSQEFEKPVLHNSAEIENNPDMKDEFDTVKAHMFNVKPEIELNLRYVLLGNIKVEIAFLSGLPMDMNGMMDKLPTMMATKGPQSKAAKSVGSVDIAFTFNTKEDVTEHLNKTNVKSQLLSQPETILETIAEGPLKGLKYSTLIGPMKEVYRLVYYGDQSRRLLNRNMMRFGSVHQMFEHLNPWNYEGYYSFCTEKLNEG